MNNKAPKSCDECGSDEIIVGVRLGQTAEHGDVGLSYNAFLGIVGTEPLVADLCDNCGLVLRLYVQEVGRKWWTKS